MRMDEDDFEQYFIRAALKEAEELEASRRPSLPSSGLTVPDSGVRRTHSCKLPGGSRRTRQRASSPAGDNGLLRAPSPSHQTHSAPHSRSSSVKKSRRPRSPRPPDENMPTRPRTGSAPLDETVSQFERIRMLQDEELCPVRQFTTSSRGLVNRGDSFKRSVRRQRGSRSRTASSNESEIPPAEPGPDDVARVILLGDHGVGKTTLMQQFLTSEYLGGQEMQLEEEGSELQVSVLLDGVETTLSLEDVPYDQRKVPYEDAECYLLVFSLTDRTSFDKVMEIVRELRRDADKLVAIILVGNKNDLVRSRVISEEEGKEACVKYGCKYIEASASMNMKVDDLLAGIAKQIRLNPKRKRRDGAYTEKARGLLDKILRRKASASSKSCDNLMVL